MRYSAMLGHANDSWCSPGFCGAGSAAVPGRAVCTVATPALAAGKKKRAAPARLDSLRGRKRRVAASRRAAHVGAARPDPRPAPHRVELETVVDRRRARVSVGWSPHPLVLSNPPGHVYRHDAHPLRARPEATLPRSAVMLIWDGL